MSATTFTATTASTPATAPTTGSVDITARPAARTRVWRAGLVSGAIASLATSLMVVAARAADVDVAIDGEEIPLMGFPQFTMLGAVIGIGLAKLLARRVRNPRSTFVRTTVVLTALSIVPDLAVSAASGSKLVLVLTHVVAAAIVVPALASRLSATAR